MNADSRARHKRLWHAKVVAAMVRTAIRAKRGLGPTKTDTAILYEDRIAHGLPPCLLSESTPSVVGLSASRRKHAWSIDAGKS